MNLLRVWGGGIYENELFYDFCDEYGVMITQDFMLACGTYPDGDAEFVESFKNEVRATVLRLRSHACLALWTGNNENGDGFDWDDPNTKNIALLSLVYRPILSELDPNRPFRPYGSYGGRENTDFTVGDNHVSWWWTGAEKIDPSWFDYVGRFSTESPLEGYSLPTVMRKFLAEEDISDDNSPITDYHIKNNMYFTRMGMLSVHDRLKRNTEIIIGNADGRYEQLYRYAYIQYEWARLTLEGMRRSKWYAAGIQYWMYNDCWPALGYAVIDFYGRPKSGWYATKYSGAPLAGTVKRENGELEFILLNDSLESGSVEYKIRLYRPELGISELMSGESEFAANVNTELAKMSLEALGIAEKDNVIVFLELYRDGERISRARWYPGWLSELNLPKAELEVSLDRENNRVNLTCTKGVALGVAVDGELIAEDNYVDILTGESRQIGFEALEGFDGISIYGYNIKI